jgi:hypothetical protein
MFTRFVDIPRHLHAVLCNSVLYANPYAQPLQRCCVVTLWTSASQLKMAIPSMILAYLRSVRWLPQLLVICLRVYQALFGQAKGALSFSTESSNVYAVLRHLQEGKTWFCTLRLVHIPYRRDVCLSCYRHFMLPVVIQTETAFSTEFPFGYITLHNIGYISFNFIDYCNCQILAQIQRIR